MERLNKFLAHAGVGSRRHCDELIAAGRVKVDGQRVTHLGHQIEPDAHKITVDDHPVRAESLVYWVVNKPPGYVCTNDDPAGRPRAVDLVPHVPQRVYTVGRLDEGSEGLLLLTNDGELAFSLMHPRYGVEKTYQVLVAGNPSREDMARLLAGVWISDGKARAKSVRRMKPQGDSTWLRITLAEGKNREIRRMLAKFGHKVMRLKRVAIGPVQLDRLPKGKSRKLSLEELKALRATVTTGQKKILSATHTARTPAARTHAARTHAAPKGTTSPEAFSAPRPSRPSRTPPSPQPSVKPGKPRAKPSWKSSPQAATPASPASPSKSSPKPPRKPSRKPPLPSPPRPRNGSPSSVFPPRPKRS